LTQRERFTLNDKKGSRRGQPPFTSTIIRRPVTPRHHTWHTAAIHRAPWAWLTGAATNGRYLWAALRFLSMQNQSQRTMGGVCAAYRRNMSDPAYKYECTARKDSVFHQHRSKTLHGQTCVVLEQSHVKNTLTNGTELLLLYSPLNSFLAGTQPF